MPQLAPGSRSPLGTPARSAQGPSRPFSPTGLGASPPACNCEFPVSCAIPPTIAQATADFGQGYSNAVSTWPPYVTGGGVAQNWPPTSGYLGQPAETSAERSLIRDLVQLFSDDAGYRRAMGQLTDAAQDYRSARDTACDPAGVGVNVPWVSQGPDAAAQCGGEMDFEAYELDQRRLEAVQVYDAMNQLYEDWSLRGDQEYAVASGGLGLAPLAIAAIVGGVVGILGGISWVVYAGSTQKAAADALASTRVAAEAVRQARLACQADPGSPACTQLTSQASQALAAAKRAAKLTASKASAAKNPPWMLLGGVLLAAAIVPALLRGRG